MSAETNTESKGIFAGINSIVWMVATVSVVHILLQSPAPPTGEACRLASMISVGHVYEVVMVKDSFAVIQDLGTKKIVLTQSMSHEVDVDNACLEAGKRYNCISINLGDGNKIKLVITNDSTKKQ